VAEKARPIGLRLIVDVKVVDGAVEMVKVTGMDCGVLVAPVAVTVMIVEYVPEASPATIAMAVNEPGAVPEIGESASHGAVVFTLQSNVPIPELEMATACPAGSLPP
jgi:hypothetical protein